METLYTAGDKVLEENVTDPHTETESAEDADWEKWRALTSEAYARFHERIVANRSRFPGLSDYAPAERARTTSGTFAWWWGASVKSKKL